MSSPPCTAQSFRPIGETRIASIGYSCSSQTPRKIRWICPTDLSDPPRCTNPGPGRLAQKRPLAAERSEARQRGFNPRRGDQMAAPATAPNKVKGRVADFNLPVSAKKKHPVSPSKGTRVSEWRSGMERGPGRIGGWRQPGAGASSQKSEAARPQTRQLAHSRNIQH